MAEIGYTQDELEVERREARRRHLGHQAQHLKRQDGAGSWTNERLIVETGGPECGYWLNADCVIPQAHVHLVPEDKRRPITLTEI
jgi:hypothetical protein